ncbi:MAG: hypothetical protein ABIE07_09640 [Candidatus Zixiibacteriota bacterium]
MKKDIIAKIFIGAPVTLAIGIILGAIGYHFFSDKYELKYALYSGPGMAIGASGNETYFPYTISVKNSGDIPLTNLDIYPPLNGTIANIGIFPRNLIGEFEKDSAVFVGDSVLSLSRKSFAIDSELEINFVVNGVLIKSDMAISCDEVIASQMENNSDDFLGFTSFAGLGFVAAVAAFLSIIGQNVEALIRKR